MMTPRSRPTMMPLRPDWLLRGIALFILWWVIPIGPFSWGAIATLGASVCCVGRAIWEAQR